MPSIAEARAAFTGFSRLLRFDAAFAGCFDRSPSGALRSFGLMLPALPCFAIIVEVAVAAEHDIETVRLLAGSAAIFILSWVLFPLCLILVGRVIEREAQAIGVITFYNWLGTTLIAIQAALSLLTLAGVPGGLPHLASMVVYYGALLFEGFAFRVLLGLGLGGALLLVLLEYTISEGLVQIWLSLLFARPFF
jgi:uncharacterized membrane protein (GlpM family)